MSLMRPVFRRGAFGFEFLPQGRRNVPHSPVPAQLQGPNVGDNSPAITRLNNLLPVSGHGSVSVIDDLEEIARRNAAKPSCVKTGRNPESTPVNHSVPVSGFRMTRTAEDVVPIVPTLQESHSYLCRNGLKQTVVR